MPKQCKPLYYLLKNYAPNLYAGPEAGVFAVVVDVAAVCAGEQTPLGGQCAVQSGLSRTLRRLRIQKKEVLQ